MSTRNQPTAGDARLTVDTLWTLGVLGVAAVAVLAGLGGPVRALLGGLLVLFLPGYALSTLAFPASAGSDTSAARFGNTRCDTSRAGLRFPERLAFSVGASVAAVPVFAWLLAGTVGFGVGPALSTVTGVTALLTVTGGVRRLRTPPGERYVFPLEAGLDLLGGLGEGQRADRLATLALVTAVFLAVGALAAGFVAPMDGQEFTQVSVLAENDGELELVGASPEGGGAGNPAELVLRVQNYENEPMRYTVVVQAQVVVDGEVTQRTQARRFSETVADGGTWERSHSVEPVGDENRVVYLLYRGEAPAELTAESAYRSVAVWTAAPDGPGVADQRQGQRLDGGG